jgi:hypothetical protein
MIIHGSFVKHEAFSEVAMKKATASGANKSADASKLIDARLAALGDWRGETLARVRALIHEAAPDIVETVKWVKPTNPFGVPVWEHVGIVCTGEVYRETVKLTFARGAALMDPAKLFNSSLDGNVRRAIDIREGEKIDARALKALVREAADYNETRKKNKART